MANFGSILKNLRTSRGAVDLLCVLDDANSRHQEIFS